MRFDYVQEPEGLFYEELASSSSGAADAVRGCQ